MFWKYRYLFYVTSYNTGPGEWRYLEVEGDESEELFVDRATTLDEPDRHGHLYGIDYDNISQVERPPIEWMKEQIEEAKRVIAKAQDRIEYFTRLIEKGKPISEMTADEIVADIKRMADGCEARTRQEKR